MRRLILLTTVLMGGLVSCSGPQRKMVWSDEFDRAGLDTSKWSYDLGDGCPSNCGWGNHELEYYTSDARNARVEGGMLIIEARKDSAGGKAFTSSRMVTKHKGDWRYGRIEIKARIPRGKGTWPAIWMLPTEWKYGGWPLSGEIDIMEHVGFDPGQIHGTIHTEAFNGAKGTQKGAQVSVQDCMDQFHLYAIDWKENTIDFFVDDNVYLTIRRDPKDGIPQWPFDQKFHLILNIAVGGDWGGQRGVDPDIWPQQLQVDYIRVYQ